MTLNTSKQCSTCKYWERIKDIVGFCHRQFDKKPLKDRNARYPRGPLAHEFEDYVCSEYEPKGKSKGPRSSDRIAYIRWFEKKYNCRLPRK